jgi:hypothetical protein
MKIEKRYFINIDEIFINMELSNDIYNIKYILIKQD